MHRFRWESIFHLESSYRFQAGSFVLTLPEGLSETANKDEEFDQYVWNEKRKHCLINEIVDIALSETQISLSIFTNLFHKRFQKHSMLESTLEILQQFYIQMEIEPDDFHFFLEIIPYTP